MLQRRMTVQCTWNTDMLTGQTVPSFRPPSQPMLKRILDVDDKGPQGYISSHNVRNRPV